MSSGKNLDDLIDEISGQADNDTNSNLFRGRIVNEGANSEFRGRSLLHCIVAKDNKIIKSK